MRLVKAYAEIWEEQGYTYEEAKKRIEKVGRVCYNSYERITEDSYEKFVGDMCKKEHYAPTEHGTVYLTFNVNERDMYKYLHNHWSSVHTFVSNGEQMCAVSTNLRVIYENGWEDDLEYITEPTQYHEKRISVQFVIDRGVSAEFNRNRANSPMERSTRYCNFANGKYSHTIEIIIPENDIDYNEALERLNAHEDPLYVYSNMLAHKREMMFDVIDWWLYANLACEKAYMNLINLGWTAQQARRVLPLDLKTVLIHTAFISDWKHFFDLRALGTTGAPHPDAKFVAMPLYKKFIELGYLDGTEQETNTVVD